MISTDQMGRTLTLAQWPPQRMVSLVPSQTEFLADLGLHKEVVGITKFCIHPRVWFEEKKRVGGTKTIDIQKIVALKPDLIIGNKEENEQSQISALAQQFPVWMSDVCDLTQALDMMLQLGVITGKKAEAQLISTSVEKAFGLLKSPTSPRKVAYLIWRKPYMAAASGTFIDDMLHRAGFDNVFSALTRYPEVSAAQLAAAAPDCIFLSSEPYPFGLKHIAELQEICPGAQIQLVDGELFSWYGSRLLQSPAYFASLC